MKTIILLTFLITQASAFVPSKSGYRIAPETFVRTTVHNSFARQPSPFPCLYATSTEPPAPETFGKSNLVGDDSAYFSLEEQKLGDWIKFTAATTTVLAAVAYVWILPAGPHGGDAFLQWIQATTGTTDPAVTVASMLTFFAVAHSGLAGLRTYAEPIVGPRAWRVVFALVSLPMAHSCLS
jgi:hypothetical protein